MAASDLVCKRCGASLADVTDPGSRSPVCDSCTAGFLVEDQLVTVCHTSNSRYRNCLACAVPLDDAPASRMCGRACWSWAYRVRKKFAAVLPVLGEGDQPPGWFYDYCLKEKRRLSTLSDVALAYERRIALRRELGGRFLHFLFDHHGRLPKGVELPPVSSDDAPFDVSGDAVSASSAAPAPRRAPVRVATESPRGAAVDCDPLAPHESAQAIAAADERRGARDGETRAPDVDALRGRRDVETHDGAHSGHADARDVGAASRDTLGEGSRLPDHALGGVDDGADAPAQNRDEAPADVAAGRGVSGEDAPGTESAFDPPNDPARGAPAGAPRRPPRDPFPAMRFLFRSSEGRSTGPARGAGVSDPGVQRRGAPGEDSGRDPSPVSADAERSPDAHFARESAPPLSERRDADLAAPLVAESEMASREDLDLFSSLLDAADASDSGSSEPLRADPAEPFRGADAVSSSPRRATGSSLLRRAALPRRVMACHALRPLANGSTPPRSLHRLRATTPRRWTSCLVLRVRLRICRRARHGRAVLPIRTPGPRAALRGPIRISRPMCTTLWLLRPTLAGRSTPRRPAPGGGAISLAPIRTFPAMSTTTRVAPCQRISLSFSSPIRSAARVSPWT